MVFNLGVIPSPSVWAGPSDLLLAKLWDVTLRSGHKDHCFHLKSSLFILLLAHYFKGNQGSSCELPCGEAHGQRNRSLQPTASRDLRPANIHVSFLGSKSAPSCFPEYSLGRDPGLTSWLQPFEKSWEVSCIRISDPRCWLIMKVCWLKPFHWVSFVTQQ